MHRKSAEMVHRDSRAWIDAEGREVRPCFLFLASRATLDRMIGEDDGR